MFGTSQTSGTTAAHATAALAEADRLMTVCNSCRYCEGLCAVFPAMEMRRSFADTDLRYLANLCHACGACYYDCQFSPPHPFDVNVPRVLAQVRNRSYAEYAWPRAAAGLFARNGLAVGLALAGGALLFGAGLAAANGPALFAAQTGPGAFYRFMPHAAMALLFGAAFLFAAYALWRGLSAFRRERGSNLQPADMAQASHDALTMRYLDGGGAGCMNDGINPRTDGRRHAHHATFYGFLLCFASTTTASFYHFVLGREAPYPWWDLPVVLGTLGGLGLLIGPAFLVRAKARRDPALREPGGRGMELAFTASLFLLGLSGLLLLLLRATPAMGVLLAVHLGFVFAFFVTAPYGKFVHGLYRWAALARYAGERRGLTAPLNEDRKRKIPA